MKGGNYFDLGKDERIILKLILNMVCGARLDSTVPVASCFEHGIKPLGSIKGEMFLDS
jgi:hypothetical protein